jgi:hypothetical protein
MNINREQAEAEFMAGLAVPIDLRMDVTTFGLAALAAADGLAKGVFDGPCGVVLSGFVDQAMASCHLLPHVRASIKAVRKESKSS